MERVRRVFILLTLAGGPMAGCELDERDLSAFIDTAAGPDKLRALLRDRTREPAFRASAALSLMSIRRPRQGGEPELDGTEWFLHDLARMPIDERGRITQALTPRIAARLSRAEPGEEPSRESIKTKDACVELLALLPDEARRTLGAAVLDFVLRDLEHRADAGRFGLEEIAQAAGIELSERLLSGLSLELPGPWLTRVSTLLDESAPAAIRVKTAERLLALERALARAEPGGDESPLIAALEPADPRALSAARTRSPEQRAELRALHLLPALGRFIEQPAVRGRLVEIGANAALSGEERAIALDLMRGHTTEAELAPLLSVALDENTSEPMRALALARATELGSAELVPQLLPLVGDRKHAELRQMATLYALEVGGAVNLVTVLRAMPRRWNMPYSRAEIDAYTQKLNAIAPTIPVVMLLGEKLHSSFWWLRVLALRYFAARGTHDDIWRIRQHVHDTLGVHGEGWPRAYSIGQEASACVAQALERFRR